MLQLAEGLLRETLGLLRACGADRGECVVYWTGELVRLGTVDAVLHPLHVSLPGHYEIDPGWHNDAWIELAHERRTIRAQVHTHPGAAFHSRTDDRFPVAQQAGLLSLVIPRYAARDDLRGAYLCELDEQGHWEERSIEGALVIP